MWGTSKHCYILNIQTLGLVVSEKMFSCFSHYKSMVHVDNCAH